MAPAQFDLIAGTCQPELHCCFHSALVLLLRDTAGNNVKFGRTEGVDFSPAKSSPRGLKREEEKGSCPAAANIPIAILQPWLG